VNRIPTFLTIIYLFFAQDPAVSGTITMAPPASRVLPGITNLEFNSATTIMLVTPATILWLVPRHARPAVLIHQLYMPQQHASHFPPDSHHRAHHLNRPCNQVGNHPDNPPAFQLVSLQDNPPANPLCNRLVSQRGNPQANPQAFQPASLQVNPLVNLPAGQLANHQASPLFNLPCSLPANHRVNQLFNRLDSLRFSLPASPRVSLPNLPANPLANRQPSRRPNQRASL
jgi:hypothetical protein